MRRIIIINLAYTASIFIIELLVLFTFGITQAVNNSMSANYLASNNIPFYLFIFSLYSIGFFINVLTLYKYFRKLAPIKISTALSILILSILFPLVSVGISTALSYGIFFLMIMYNPKFAEELYRFYSST